MGSSHNSSQYNNFQSKVDSNPIADRVRRKCQRLPSSRCIKGDRRKFSRLRNSCSAVAPDTTLGLLARREPVLAHNFRVARSGHNLKRWRANHMSLLATVRIRRAYETFLLGRFTPCRHVLATDLPEQYDSPLHYCAEKAIFPSHL